MPKSLLVAALTSAVILFSILLFAYAYLAPSTVVDETMAEALAANDPQLGRRVYVRCQACHGIDGRGIDGNYPPLVGSPRLLDPDPAIAIRVVLHGRPRTTLNGVMPAFADLADHEIAGVLTWARSQWGNHSSPITATMVAEIRKQP